MSFKEVVFDTKDMSLEEQLYTRWTSSCQKAGSHVPQAPI